MDEVEWEYRSAVIAGEDGRGAFEQRDIEIMWVVDTITGWGEKQAYLADAQERYTFHAEVRFKFFPPTTKIRDVAKGTCTPQQGAITRGKNRARLPRIPLP